MEKAKLNSEFIATVAGDITVFNYDGGTREYQSSSVEYLPVGVGIPANSCTDAPGGSKEGFALCRTVDFTAWEYVVDYRGETIYNIESGEAMTVTALGCYPENTTTLKPATRYDKWNGSEWVIDTDAQHAADVAAAEQTKQNLLVAARSTISIWQTELQLGSISEEDKSQLIVWLAYIKEVQAANTSGAPDINWPESPAV